MDSPKGPEGPKGPAGPTKTMNDEFARRSNTIEECYEFMLAYAAQGLPGDAGSQSGGELREYPETRGRRADGAVGGRVGDRGHGRGCGR